MAAERTVVRLRRHALCLLPPAVALVLLAAGTGALAGRIPSAPGRLVVVLVALVLLLRLVLVPFARWRAATYLVTQLRVAVAGGVLHRVRRDVPLAGVRDVVVRRRWWQVPIGAGTVVVSVQAGEPLVLADAPRARLLRRTLLGLAEAAGADLAAPGPRPGRATVEGAAAPAPGAQR